MFPLGEKYHTQSFKRLTQHSVIQYCATENWFLTSYPNLLLQLQYWAMLEFCMT